MATYNGTTRDDTWTVVSGGTFSIDGGLGVDTLDLGTSLRSDYTITLGANGTVKVDTLSGASQVLRATLTNIELLKFNSGRDVVDLRTFFGDTAAPTGSLSAPTQGASNASVTAPLTLGFNEAIKKGSGLITLVDTKGTVVASWDMATSPGVSISGSTLSLTLPKELPGGTALTLKAPAGVVLDLAGNAWAGLAGSSFTTATIALAGTAGNDTIAAHSGVQTVDGGLGTDIFVLSQARSAYTLTPGAPTQLTALDGSSKVDLVGVERFQFADFNVAVDFQKGANAAGGNAALTTKAISAVLGPEWVSNQGIFGLALYLLDVGMPYETLIQAGLDHPLYRQLAANGAAQVSPLQMVKQVFENVNGRLPSDAEAAAIVAGIDAGADAAARAALTLKYVVDAAESPANAIAVNLVGLASAGAPYLPFTPPPGS